MKDSLKDFIGQHRDEFDHREPSENSWSKIQKTLFGSTSTMNSLMLWKAAAVIFFALSAGLLVLYYNATTSRKEISQLQGEFSDLESFYGSQIADKVALINNYEDAYEDDQYTQDVQKLDAMYQVLKEEMKVKPSAKVKDALILNMLVRIDLLNQQIKKLEESRKPDDGEASQI